LRVSFSRFRGSCRREERASRRTTRPRVRLRALRRFSRRRHREPIPCPRGRDRGRGRLDVGSRREAHEPRPRAARERRRIEGKSTHVDAAEDHVGRLGRGERVAGGVRVVIACSDGGGERRARVGQLCDEKRIVVRRRLERSGPEVDRPRFVMPLQPRETLGGVGGGHARQARHARHAKRGLTSYRARRPECCRGSPCYSPPLSEPTSISGTASDAVGRGRSPARGSPPARDPRARHGRGPSPPLERVPRTACVVPVRTSPRTHAQNICAQFSAFYIF
jgi:hypothetical protein